MAITPYAPGYLDTGNDLGRRYITDFPRVESFYASDFRRIEHLASLANRLLNRTWKPRFDRALTASLLRDYSALHHAPDAVMRNLDRLEHPQSVCVLTGQQAGLGGGPLLTLYKAATAIRLAHEVERATGQTCIPVFWNASDDSDVEEVNRLRSAGDEGLRRFRFNLDAGRRHVREITLPDAGDPQWDEAAAALGRGPFRDRAEALLRAGAGLDFGAAFTRVLLSLLGDQGLVVIEPKALSAHPSWRRIHGLEIEQREENRQALQRVSERLESMGLPAGVPITSHLNLFITDHGDRQRVGCEGKRLVVEGRDGTTSMTALLKELKEDPAAFTPNVLLRPLVQNAIFPTVAYVGGMAEIAYHGLLKGLHRSMRVFMPALFPRVSMTLLRAEDAQAFDAAVAFRRRLKWRQREAEIVQDGARSGIQDAFLDLKEELMGLGRGLDPDLQKFEQRTQRSINDVMVRVRHDALTLIEGGGNVAPLLARYFPEDKPQERVISVLAAYAEMGPALIQAAMSAGDVFDFSHRAAVA